MKNYLTLFICLFSIQLVFAQPPQYSKKPTKGIGKIAGTIVDSETQKPVEYATISLYDQTTGKLINGTVADDRGKFAIRELVDGMYKLEISFIGYEVTEMKDIEMKKEKNVNVGKIKINGIALELNEVEVTGERSIIEEKVDRMVYNADQDDLAKGGDGADVLRKVPLLTVDLEGNVSLRGSANILVLINNKPSTILASSVADALKMIPAEQIKKVEVITSPSAKYDAEGSGGIINIITKRNNLEGYNLNINTAVGLRASNLSLNGNFRKGKFGMSLGGFGRAFYNRSESDLTQTTVLTQITTLQNAKGNNLGYFARYNLGMDYDIDKTQFLSGGIRFGGRSFTNDMQQTTEISDNTVLLNAFLRNIDGINSSNSIDANLDYLKKFSDQKEFSISTLFSNNIMTNNFTSDNLDVDEILINSLRNINDNTNQEFTLQTDFQTPIKENQMFEIGAKGIFRQVNSDYSYLFADASLNYLPDASQPAGELDYQQNVSSGYASYTYSTKSKFTIKAGARFENTAISASQDGENIDIPNYSNLVPSINMSKRLKNYSTIKLGYNRRIQRPWLQQLNPNVNVSNSQDIQVGNPNLRPELADNIELGYSAMIKKTYLNITGFGRLTNNSINQIRTPIDSIPGAILTTYANIGKERATGINMFANINITDNFSINGGFNAFYAFLEGQVAGLDGTTETITNDGLNISGRLMSTMKLQDGWSLQAFAFMRGRKVQLQGVTGGYGVYVFGANKDFKNKKGSFGLSLENFMTRGWNMRSTLESPTFLQESNNLMLNRSIRVNFSYKLGKMDFRAARKKTKSVNNDDLMGGGGNSSGGASSGGSSRPSSSGGGRPSTSKKKKTKKSDKKKKGDEKSSKTEQPKKEEN